MLCVRHPVVIDFEHPCLSIIDRMSIDHSQDWNIDHYLFANIESAGIDPLCSGF